eukprot:4228175-Prymnesium_polylepis.3
MEYTYAVQRHQWGAPARSSGTVVTTKKSFQLRLLRESSSREFFERVLRESRRQGNELELVLPASCLVEHGQIEQAWALAPKAHVHRWCGLVHGVSEPRIVGIERGCVAFASVAGETCHAHVPVGCQVAHEQLAARRALIAAAIQSQAQTTARCVCQETGLIVLDGILPRAVRVHQARQARAGGTGRWFDACILSFRPESLGFAFKLRLLAPPLH